MRTCARGLAFLIVILFLLTAPISLILWNVDNYLLTPDPYLRALEEEDFAARLPLIAAEQITYSLSHNPCLEDPQNCEGGEGALSGETDEGGPPAYLRDLSVEQWRTILGTLLEPGWLETQVEALLADLFGNLEPGSSTEPIVISLDELKTNLAGPQGVTLIEELLAARPPCSAAQLLELAIMDLSQPSLDRLLTCNPPPEVIALVMPELKSALDQAAQQLPSQITIDAFDSVFANASGAEGAGGSAFMRARLLMRFTPFVPLTLMLLIGLLAVRSLRDLGWWIGFPLLVTGASLAGVGWFAPGAVEWAVQRFVTPVLPSTLSPLTSSFILDMVLRVGRLTADRVAFQALVIVVLGAGMLVIGLLVKPRRRVEDIAPLTKPRGGANEGG
jgi:hypothetical protein